eukprot:360056-Chlamydomonas_euryale.AAC.19
MLVGKVEGAEPPPGTAFEMVPGVPRRWQISGTRLAECPTASSAPPSAPPGCQTTKVGGAWAQWKRSGKPAAEG